MMRWHISESVTLKSQMTFYTKRTAFCVNNFKYIQFTDLSLLHITCISIVTFSQYPFAYKKFNTKRVCKHRLETEDGSTTTEIEIRSLFPILTFSLVFCKFNKENKNNFVRTSHLQLPQTYSSSISDNKQTRDDTPKKKSF